MKEMVTIDYDRVCFIAQKCDEYNKYERKIKDSPIDQIMEKIIEEYSYYIEKKRLVTDIIDIKYPQFKMKLTKEEAKCIEEVLNIPLIDAMNYKTKKLKK